MTSPAIQRAEKEIKSNKIVIFVKGTPLAPQCGFSASVMDLFNKLGAHYQTVDILAIRGASHGSACRCTGPRLPALLPC